MNIQKRRITAIATMVLVVCMMVATMALPASAATVTVNLRNGCMITAGYVYEPILKAFKADLHGYSDYSALLKAMGLGVYDDTSVYVSTDQRSIYVQEGLLRTVANKYNALFPDDTPLNFENIGIVLTSSKGKEVRFLVIPNPGVTFDFNEETIEDTYTYETVDTVEGAFDFLDESDLWHLMDEIKGILPAAVQALVGFIAIRKSIEFLQWCMHKA